MSHNNQLPIRPYNEAPDEWPQLPPERLARFKEKSKQISARIVAEIRRQNEEKWAREAEQAAQAAAAQATAA
jgi:hypothetical protein